MRTDKHALCSKLHETSLVSLTKAEMMLLPVDLKLSENVCSQRSINGICDLC